MKLRLGDFISQAKQLLRSEAKVTERVGCLIRRRAVGAAQRCAKLGRDNDVQARKSLKEFLAFFSVVSVTELGIRLGARSDPELRSIYDNLVKAVCTGHEPDPTVRAQQVAISGLMTYKRSGFDHWFYGYWNADLEGMRITSKDLQILKERGISGPTGDYSGDASFILLVRISRLENAAAAIPSAPVVSAYDAVIREEVKGFTDDLRKLLK